MKYVEIKTIKKCSLMFANETVLISYCKNNCLTFDSRSFQKLNFGIPMMTIPKNLRNFKNKDKIPKELFNFKYFYYCKQSRIRRPVIFIAQSKSHGFCAIHVASVSKGLSVVF